MNPFRSAAVVEPQPLLTPEEANAARLVGLTDEQFADVLCDMRGAPPKFRESFLRMAVLDARINESLARIQARRTEETKEPSRLERFLGHCIPVVLFVFYFGPIGWFVFAEPVGRLVSMLGGGP